jgi:predicted nucleic acid-binding protein
MGSLPRETMMVVDANALVKVFLKALNQEDLINNQTYMVAVDKLEKEEVENNVD